MKRYSLLLLFALAAFTARAQFVGDVSVTRKALCERNGSLYMLLDVRVSGSALTRSQSWTIIPELSTPDRQSVKLFPHIQIDGKYQRRMALRRRVLTGAYWVEREPYKVINVTGREDVEVRYEMSVPYEAWMDRASLVIRQIQTSPGDRRRVFTIDVNGAVDHGSRK